MVKRATCLTCGEQFTPHRSAGKPQVRCSEQCRRKAANLNYANKNRPDRVTACAECGGPVAHDLSSGRPRRFCSDECKARAGNRALRRRRLPIRDPNPEPKTCAHCGTPFVPKRRDQIYCSNEKSYPYCAVSAYQARKRAGEPLRQVEQTKTCQECGEDFTAHKSNARWCSSQCRRRFTAREESRRRGPVRPDHVPYTDLEIFERDRWRCHLCGKRVDRNLPRTHRDGATVDHLVPLSEGGADAPANVATAHNRCNRGKGVRAVNEQLRLI